MKMIRFCHYVGRPYEPRHDDWQHIKDMLVDLDAVQTVTILHESPEWVNVSLSFGGGEEPLNGSISYHTFYKYLEEKDDPIEVPLEDEIVIDRFRGVRPVVYSTWEIAELLGYVHNDSVDGTTFLQLKKTLENLSRDRPCMPAYCEKVRGRAGEWLYRMPEFTGDATVDADKTWYPGNEAAPAAPAVVITPPASAPALVRAVVPQAATVATAPASVTAKPALSPAPSIHQPAQPALPFTGTIETPSKPAAAVAEPSVGPSGNEG